MCPDGSEPELKDGQYKCQCECKDGSIREQKEDGTCDCSCKCADGSEDTLAQNGCPCKCECKNCLTSKKTSDGGCDCPNENPPPKCYWEKTPNPFYSPVTSWLPINPYNCKLKCEPDDPPPPPPGPSGGYTDVHFDTFDKRSYDYQGVGEFIYCIDKKTDFAIQMRNYWLNNNDYVSWIGGLAVKLADSIFTVFIDKKYDSIIRLNGIKLNDTNRKFFSINDEIALTIESIYKITIERKFHSSITITRRGNQLNIFLYVLESDKFVLSNKKKFSGFCGTNDDNFYNDFTGSDGKIYANINEFANSWRIFYTKDVNTIEWDWERSNFHRDDILDERFFPIPKNKLYPMIQTRAVSMEIAEIQCKNLELTEVLLEACILDLISSGDENMTKTEAYQAEICPTQCSLKGQCIGKDECECFDGWTGPDCSKSQCQYECGPNGKCSGGLCICEFGWVGLNCSVKITCEKVNNCTDINHGICIGENKCLCFEGYGGYDCGKSASCFNLNNCSNNGICASDSVCSCNSGWSGKNFSNNKFCLGLILDNYSFIR